MRVVRVPPIAGGTIALGGVFRAADVLPVDGRGDVDNGADADDYDEQWIQARVRELVALYDNPLYSFFAGVEALTREKSLRTTMLAGDDAVAELFAGADEQPDRFYHRMPGNVIDQERLAAPSSRLREDIIVVDKEAYASMVESRARASTRTERPAAEPYPVIGHIGADVSDAASEGSRAPPGSTASVPPAAGAVASAATPAQNPAEDGSREYADSGASIPLAAGATAPAVVPRAAPVPPAREASAAGSRRIPSLVATAPRAPSVVLPANAVDPASLVLGAASVVVPNEAALNQNPALLRSTARRNPDGSVSVQVRQTQTNIVAPGPDGRDRAFHNIEDGDVVAARRLLAGQQMSDADERVWRLVYQGGAGVTAPLPRTAPDEIRATRMRQRQDIVHYARSIRDRRQLHWRLLPEHLRTLFLTREATTALEHAVWLAHYQQPWDPNSPAPMQTPFQHHQRAMVPPIDLMTHEMVRVPFQTLVANIIIYWRQRRAADKARADESLAAINGVILTLKSMRESANGFVSLLGHYDVEARRSRFNIEQERLRYMHETGTYWSDMDRSFYAGAVEPGTRPGPRAAALLQRQAPADPMLSAAVAASLAAADRRFDPLAAIDDARYRYNLVANALMPSRRRPRQQF